MITLSSDQLKRAEEALKHIADGMPKAAARAINRAAEGGRTAAVKKITQEYTITPGRIRQKVEIRPKATADSLLARVYVLGKPLPLSYFKTKPKSVPRKRPSNPLFAKVKQSGGGPIRKVFLAKMDSGHVGVFARSKNKRMTKGKNIRKSGKRAGKKIGGKRWALIQEYGPSLPQMMGNTTVTKYIEKKAQEVLDKRLEREINHLLRGGK